MKANNFLDLIRRIEPWPKEFNNKEIDRNTGEYLYDFLQFMKSWDSFRNYRSQINFINFWKINSFYENIGDRFQIDSPLIDSLHAFNLVVKERNTIFWNLDQKSTLVFLFNVWDDGQDEITFHLYLQNRAWLFKMDKKKFHEKLLSKEGLISESLIPEIKKEKEFLMNHHLKIHKQIRKYKEKILLLLIKEAIFNIKWSFPSVTTQQNSILEAFWFIVWDLKDSRLQLLHHLQYLLSFFWGKTIKTIGDSFSKMVFDFFALYIVVLNSK